MQRTTKPKNARSKRALQAREPKAVEDAKTAVFVRGSQTSEKVRIALSELQQLKAPNSILFSKRNLVHPFSDPSPFLFWSLKTDASLFLHGSHSKKRPNNLTFIRLFDGQILDMLEVGVEGARSMRDFPGVKASPGVAPLFHFSGELWDQDEQYGHFRDMVLDLFRGEQMKAIDLVQGLQYVISVSVGPLDDEAVVKSLLDEVGTVLITSASPDASSTPVPAAASAPAPAVSLVDGPTLPSSSSNAFLIHFRTYSITLLRSGHIHPRVSLAPHGPFFDFSLRRSQPPTPETLKEALKKSQPKTEAGKARKGNNKNVDVDEMGDKVGRVHMGKQDLERLQSRKMKGLKRSARRNEEEDAVSDIEMEAAGGDDIDVNVELEGDSVNKKRKR